MPTPNILIILADDLGNDVFRIDEATKKARAHVVGTTSSAGPVELPTFSRMLQHGVNFKHAWAHPVCTPTRGSLWTGLHPWRTGLGYPSFAGLDPTLAGDDELPRQTVTGTAVQTLPEALKAGGANYRCAMFGKWDLGSENNPVKRGWNAFAGTFRGALRGDASQYYGFPPGANNVAGSFLLTWDRLRNATTATTTQLAKCQEAAAMLESKYGAAFLQNARDLRFYAWEKDVVDGTGAIVPNRSRPSQREFLYATEDEVEDAKRWINTNKSLGPWCVAVNLITPHDPFHVPPPGTFTTKFVNPSKPTVQEMLAAMIESMDFYVKRLLDGLGDQLQNTVVIFVGDNGTQDADPDDRTTSIDATVGDDKGTDAVGAVHVPMIVADGGLLAGKTPCYVQAAGRSAAGAVHIIDLYNTVLEIAGAKRPTNDSVSMAPTLAQQAPTPRKTSFSQMYTAMPFKFGVKVASMVCDGAHEYKLSCAPLTNAQGQLLNRAGTVVTTPVLDYKFVRIIAEAGIVGSFAEQKLDVFEPLTDGSFRIKDPAYSGKIVELYTALQQQYLDNKKQAFPVIQSPVQKLADSVNVARNRDGRLEAFAIGTDDALLHIYQTKPSAGPWSGWNSRGGRLTGVPATGLNADGRLQVFARGSDGGLWHVYQTMPSAGPWSGWSSMGGVITSDPTVSTNADGRLEVFARGTDNAIWHIWQVAPNSGWSGWASFGGVLTSQTSVFRNADGRLELFARGTDNALWHIWQLAPNSTWSGWASMGGVITSNPKVFANADGRLEVFARGTDNALWHIYQTRASTGPWSGWSSMGGVITSDPAIGKNADGRLEVFARGTDNALWHIWQVAPNSGWSSWASRGSALGSTPTVIANSDGRLEVFVQGTDNALWHVWQTAPNNGWSGWSPFAGGIKQFITPIG